MFSFSKAKICSVAFFFALLSNKSNPVAGSLRGTLSVLSLSYLVCAETAKPPIELLNHGTGTLSYQPVGWETATEGMQLHPLLRRLQVGESELLMQQTAGNSSLNGYFVNLIDSHDYKTGQVLVHECQFLSNSGTLPCVTLIDSDRKILRQGVYGDSFNTNLLVDFTEITPNGRLLVVCRLGENVVNFWVALEDELAVFGDPIRVTEDKYVAYGISLAFYNPNEYYYLIGLDPVEQAVMGMNFENLRTRYTLFESFGEFYNLGPPVPWGYINRQTVHYVMSNNGKGRCTITILEGNAFFIKWRYRLYNPPGVYGVTCLHMGIERKSNAIKFYYVATNFFLRNDSLTPFQNRTAVFYISSERDPTVQGVRPSFKRIVQQHLLDARHRGVRFFSIDGDTVPYMTTLYDNQYIHISQLADGEIVASQRVELINYPIGPNTEMKTIRYVASQKRLVMTLQSGPSDGITIYLPLPNNQAPTLFRINRTLEKWADLSFTSFDLIKTSYGCKRGVDFTFLSCIGFTFVYPSLNLGAPYALQRLDETYRIGVRNFFTGPPTRRPTQPSYAPTDLPSAATNAPSNTPTQITQKPTLSPTAAPTTSPTLSPTFSRGRFIGIYRITFPQVDLNGLKIKKAVLTDFKSSDSQNKMAFFSLNFGKNENRAQLLFINELGRIERNNSLIYSMELSSFIVPTKIFPGGSGGLSSTQTFIVRDQNENRVRILKQGRGGKIEGVFKFVDLPVDDDKAAWMPYNKTHQFAYVVVPIDKKRVYLLLCGLNFFEQVFGSHHCRASSEKHLIEPIGEPVIRQESVCILSEIKTFKDSDLSLLYSCFNMNQSAVAHLEVKENYPIQSRALLPYGRAYGMTFINLADNRHPFTRIELMVLNTHTHHLNCTIFHISQNISYTDAAVDNHGFTYLVGAFKGKIFLVQLKECFLSWATVWPLPYTTGIKMRFDPSSSSAIMRLLIPEKNALYYTYFFLANGSNHLWRGAPLILSVREIDTQFSYQTSDDVRFKMERVVIKGGSIRNRVLSLAAQTIETRSRGQKKEADAFPTWGYVLIGSTGFVLLGAGALVGVLYYKYKRHR